MKNLIRSNNKIFKLVVSLISLLIILCVVFCVSKIPNMTSEKIPTLEINKINNTQENTINLEEKTKEVFIAKRNKEIEDLTSIEDEMMKFIKFKGICCRYEESTGIKEDTSEKLRNIFTLEEIYLMQRVIETECYQTDFMSKVNVASVILNRLDNYKFADTVKEIVTLPYQFAYGRKYISYDTVLALEYAVYYGDTTNGALFFHSLDKTNTFNNYNYIFTDDAGHHFYG
jgi:hypothetical protein